MNSLTKETKLTILYIVIAFSFSVAMRMIWYFQFSGYEPFMFNGQFMINTNDGYFWAEGARDILSGISQDNDRSPITLAPSKLIAFFAYILPLSFESIILYMPIFLSSLIVIPIILIARSINNLEMGFIAALFASITWSYYNRTMIGYLDTDMLNIVLPMFLLWSIIVGINTKDAKYLIITVISILIYSWWYHQSYTLGLLFFSIILLYTLLWDRKNLYNYKFLAIVLLAIININIYFKIILILGVFYIFKQKKLQKYIYYIFAFSIILFLITGGFDPVVKKIKIYFFTDIANLTDNGIKLYFYSVMQTIREAGQISFETFANRISGHTITFILSVIGYLYLVYRYKIMLFSIPMIGLGFLASVAGLRFTVYAVPALAFGIAFLITEFARIMPTNKIKYLSIITFVLVVIYPNFLHIESYKVPTVFNSNEVKVLSELKTISDREDYVVAWWDYGYPIRYYSDVKTLVDGGKHSGDVNFPISFMLTNSQNVSAKMARLDVEYTERYFEISKKNINLEESKKTKLNSNIEEMTKNYGFNDTNDFLFSLETDIKLPNKTRDIYFYLPYKMLDIYPTVKIFSSIDLMNGEMKKQTFFYVSKRFKQKKNIIDLGRGILFDLKSKIVKIGNQEVPVKRFVKTTYDENMQFQKEVQKSNAEGINVIYMSNYNTFLVLDDESYNSLYIQLMVLEEYDKTLFEQVIISPHAKVYKLKI